MRVVRETNFAGISPAARGKVRDIYDLGDKLLIVASDRLSAFDVVLADRHSGQRARADAAFALLVRPAARRDSESRAERDRISCCSLTRIARNWRAARWWCARRGHCRSNASCAATFRVRDGKIIERPGKFAASLCPPACGSRIGLPEPIFTPATKAATGHDENISFDQAAALIGSELAERVRDISIEIYRRAAQYAEPRGILLADTKFEFGLLNDSAGVDELIWIDEALTPDSSRFWPAAQYQPGGPQPSFDKQFVRDYLERIHWPKTPPGPELAARRRGGDACQISGSVSHPGGTRTRLEVRAAGLWRLFSGA